jgi:hypothetical protein
MNGIFMIDGKDEEIKADSGYVDEKIREEILEKHPHVKLRVRAKAFRNRPLTDGDKGKI